MVRSPSHVSFVTEFPGYLSPDEHKNLQENNPWKPYTICPFRRFDPKKGSAVQENGIDFFRTLTQWSRSAMMKTQPVERWMTKDPITINPDTTVPEAHDLMKNFHIRRLPVMDEGELVGIVTLGDIREARPSDATSLSIFELNYLLSRLTVERIMTRDLITVAPSDTIGTAAKLMLEYKIGGLPVLAGPKLVGIITESDIFRVLVREEEAEVQA